MESFFLFFSPDGFFFSPGGLVGGLVSGLEMGRVCQVGGLLMLGIRDIRRGLGRIEGGMRENGGDGRWRTVVMDRVGSLEALVEGVGACCLGSLRLNFIMYWCSYCNSWRDGSPVLASLDAESTVG